MAVGHMLGYTVFSLPVLEPIVTFTERGGVSIVEMMGTSEILLIVGTTLPQRKRSRANSELSSESGKSLEEEGLF